MHVVFVFVGSSVTGLEERLVRATASLPHVRRVTLCALAPQKGVVALSERLRANVERAVARASLPLADLATLADDTVRVHDVAAPDLQTMLESVTPDRVVNLSGFTLGAGAARSDVLDLWWDDLRPEGLGAARAAAAPAQHVVVTLRRSGNEAVYVAQRSRLTRTPENPAGDRRNASSRSLALLLRALRQTDIEAGEKWTLPHAPPSAPAVRLWNASIATAGTIVAAVLRRASRTLWRRDAWELRYRTDARHFVANTTTIKPDGFRVYRAGYDRFYADPIAFSHNGIDAVFMEEYPHSLGRGVISCALLQADATLSRPQRILERPYHLSYPFVFRAGEGIFMIPETSQNRTVELYRCTRFPDEWVLERTLLRDIAITDATVHFDGERWWMFATVGDEGSYGWDELHLFMADSLAAEWTPHPANPVKCDPRTARPAGPLFRKDGRLIRPTQDCSRSYGGAVNLCEIEVLTDSEFREREVDRLAPGLFAGMNGLHTLSATDRLEVIDVRPRCRARWAR